LLVVEAVVLGFDVDVVTTELAPCGATKTFLRAFPLSVGAELGGANTLAAAYDPANHDLAYLDAQRTGLQAVGAEPFLRFGSILETRFARAGPLNAFHCIVSGPGAPNATWSRSNVRRTRIRRSTRASCATRYATYKGSSPTRATKASSPRPDSERRGVQG
jgi:hypothetical protein